MVLYLEIDAPGLPLHVQHHVSEGQESRKMLNSIKQQQYNGLKIREKKRLYLLFFCEGKSFLQQPQTFLEGDRCLKIESRGNLWSTDDESY